MASSRNGSRVVPAEVDVVVVGAGFSGLYMLHRLRSLGFSTVVFDEAGDVGGTWFWNRYPGARCDIPTTDYAYSFDPQLERDWTWSEKYARQPEILAYLRHVADRYDLRRDIRFGTQITAAVWDEAGRRWQLRTDRGDEVSCRYYVMASGCLSLPKTPDIEGVDRYAGEVYLTGRWPHEPVDFTGKRVAVVGTGSSGIQCIPLIAAEAPQLTVFQRTPNFSVPAHNGPPPADRIARLAADRDSYREAARWSRGGVPVELTEVSGLTAPEDVRRQRFEGAWQAGELFAILGVFADQGVNPVSNQLVAEMIREKIRAIVKDPDTAEALCPKDHPFGTKRPCLDTSYFETFNLSHVRLVDLRRTPIVAVTEAGIDT
ncbi:MAG TPA: NAD(P)/FAD-dependent oxidoreductase, partial [Streptosporangiaceae bacterium]|nr:NAD(P)/FAD-dependent oxidoreductase [Streptosporangiaceae bacterium]